MLRDSRGDLKFRKIVACMTRARKGFRQARPLLPLAFSGCVWIKSYMTNFCRLHEVFQKWSRWGWVDRSLIKLEEGPLITGYLGVELARVNTRGDIYPNARKLCVRSSSSSSSVPFQPPPPPRTPLRVFYDDQCKELRDKKREKKARPAEGRRGKHP